MLRHTFREIVIDDIRYFPLVGIPVEELEPLGAIGLRQVGFGNLFGATYLINEQQMQEILNKDENE